MGHFVWDETAYLVLDIGFVWNIYLDGEMGLLPESVAMTELRAQIPDDFDNATHLVLNPDPSPIQSVDFLETDDGRRLVFNCDRGTIVVETSISTREINVSRNE